MAKGFLGYAKCISGRHYEAKRRIEEATGFGTTSR
jgi:hypothetical protein